MEAPLISVLVVSYRNVYGLYETIKSVCLQSYENIELIISDDGSPEFSVELPKLKKFVEENNRGNITSIVFNSIPVNVGTVKNLNRAIDLSTGKYVKTIAAEDVFTHRDVLLHFVEYMQESSYKVVFGKIRGVKQDGSYVYNLPSCESDYDLLRSYTQKEMLNRLFKSNCLPGVGEFIDADIFKTFGKFPEEIRLIEDYPFWLILSLRDVQFGFIDEVMVDYKLSGVSSSGLYTEAFMDDLKKIHDLYIFPNDNRYGRFQKLYNHLKIAGLNYYTDKAKVSNLGRLKQLIVTIKYLPFALYDFIRRVGSR